MLTAENEKLLIYFIFISLKKNTIEEDTKTIVCNRQKYKSLRKNH